MSVPTSYRPTGYQCAVPSLSVDGALEAIEFYKTAFGATVDHTMLDPSGAKVMHSTLRFGEDRTAVFVSDVFREWGSIPSNVGITIYVPDPDAAFKRAVEAGATVKEPPSDMFWGERSGRVADKHGLFWSFSKVIKVMSPEEMKAAGDAWMASMPPPPSASSAASAPAPAPADTAAPMDAQPLSSPTNGSKKRGRKDTPPQDSVEPRETRTRGKKGKA